MTPEEDTPRVAFTLLSWRINLIVVAALVALSVLAWQSTLAKIAGVVLIALVTVVIARPAVLALISQ